MNRLTKTFLLTFTLILGATGLFAEKANVIALHFHGDHCGSCKVLNPKLEEARANLGNISMLYVKLDHTNKDTTRQAKMLVEALGLTKIYEAQKKATGYALLIDLESMEIVGKLTKKDSSEDIERRIRTSLSS